MTEPTPLPGGFIARRDFLQRAGGGIGALGLLSLLQEDGYTAPPVSTDPLAPRIPHYPAKIKRVISVFCFGGLSHMESFDPKPELTRMDGTPVSGNPKFDTGGRSAPGKLMKSPWEFRNYGQSGMPVSSLFPNIAKHVDEFALIRSMKSDSNNHVPAVYHMLTGSILAGRPGLGSWVSYGLGTENRSLPSFVVMTDPRALVGGGAGLAAQHETLVGLPRFEREVFVHLHAAFEHLGAAGAAHAAAARPGQVQPRVEGHVEHALVAVHAQRVGLAVEQHGERHFPFGAHSRIGVTQDHRLARLSGQGLQRGGCEALGVHPVGPHAGVEQGLLGRIDHGRRTADEHLVHAGHRQQRGDERAHLVAVDAAFQQRHLLRLAREDVDQREPPGVFVFEVLQRFVEHHAVHAPVAINEREFGVR